MNTEMKWPPEVRGERELAEASYAFWDAQCQDLADRRTLCFLQSRMEADARIQRMHWLAICRRDDARKALGAYQ